MQNTENLKMMIKIYNPNGFDWMNFTLSKNNPYTFHHIMPRSLGGSDSIDNGAILTRMAHNLLHTLEYVCPDAFNDLQEIFVRVNQSKKPIDNETANEIDNILYNIFTGEKYTFTTDIDLSNYVKLYYNHKKNKNKAYRK